MECYAVVLEVDERKTAATKAKTNQNGLEDRFIP